MKTLFEVKLLRSEGTTKWKFLEKLLDDDETLNLILSDKITSPLEYLRLADSPIESTEGLIMLLAIRKANMTGYRMDSACGFHCNRCLKMAVELAIIFGYILVFPFGFESESNFFSLLTCSGETEQNYTLTIIFEPFHSLIWIFILSCVFLLLATNVVISTFRNFTSIVYSGILLVLGTFGYDISGLSDVKKSRFFCFFILWSFVGILIGNLYQARLTESLVMPQEFSPFDTVQQLVDQNFTILIISDSKYEAALPPNPNLLELQKYWLQRCYKTQFCEQIIRNQEYNSTVNRFIDLPCLENILDCEKYFLGKSYLKRLPELITIVKNYTSLMSQLSSCLKNVVFIHSRREMHKIVKPKMPNVVSTYRREFKYLPLPDDTVINQPMICFTEGVRLIELIVRRYVEHGIYASWANLASILMFHWNTGVKQRDDEEYKTYTSKLDEKFVSILFTLLCAYAFAMIAFVLECLFSPGRKKRVLIPVWNHFFGFFLPILQTVPKIKKNYILFWYYNLVSQHVYLVYSWFNTQYDKFKDIILIVQRIGNAMLSGCIDLCKINV